MMQPTKSISHGAVLLVLLLPVLASADVLVNNGDSWQREADPGSTFNGDLISVWSTLRNDGGGPNERYGAVEFDLSGHTDPITAVALSLWSQAFGFSDDDTPHQQTAFIIDPAGLPNADSLSYDDVAGATVLAVLNGLGSYDLPPVGSTPEIQDVFLHSLGDAADVAAVEAVRTSGDPRLIIVLDAVEDGVTAYSRSWGDGEFGGEDAMLLTNADVIPEPNSFLLFGIGLFGLRRRRS